MADMTTNSEISEMDIWLRIANRNPLLFYGVVVTGGVVIVLILCLIFVCLSLACRSQRNSKFCRAYVGYSNICNLIMLQEEIPLLLGYNWLKKEVQTINNLIIITKLGN